MLRRVLAVTVILFAVVTLVQAAAPPAAGNWLLSTVGPTGESVLCIIKTETKDGKPFASVVFGRPNIEFTVKDFKANDKEVSFTLHQSRTVQGRAVTSDQSFIGVVGGDSKEILGSLGDDRFASRVKLSATDKDKLEQDELTSRGTPLEQYQKITQLNAKAAASTRKYQQETDPEKKKEIQAEIMAARKELDEQMPVLYREIVEKHANNVFAADAALTLIRMAARQPLTAEDAARFVKVIEKHSMPYGTRLWRNNMVQVAELLNNQKGMEAIALAAVEPVAKGVTDRDKASVQVRVLNAYETALEKAGRAAEAKSITERLAKLETILDKEYLATVPPFKPATFGGRKEAKANQVAVMELFTGAQCPPCVAADVAFDALAKAYKHNDLILIQYHMHIPGPDPMTNRDSIARWDYYREKYKAQIGGTPSTLFNGKPFEAYDKEPTHRGGGGMANAEAKYKQYAEIINPLLENTTSVGIAGKTSLNGDKLDIAVEVTGATPEGEDLRLRLLLVEDTVKYVGGNGLRFHHHVVRGLPGGATGIVINEKNFRNVTTANLGEIKAGLKKYLADYPTESKREFPTKARPLDLAHLKVIAIVQNDKTKEILQAAMFDVGNKADVGSK